MAERGIHDVNRAVWQRGHFVDEYAGRELRPVEEVLLARYRDALRGRVLELGCGAGRVTSHLVEMADDVHGIDISPAMVAHAREHVPGATFVVGDMTDLSPVAGLHFDAALATYNLIDVLDDDARGAQLDRMHEVMVPGGLLLMSSHNRGAAANVRGPGVRVGHPLKLAADVVRLPRRLRNHRRLRGLEREEPGYALVNDSGEDYALVHYYISRDAQERQLAEHGFELVECVDLDGRPVGPGDDAPDTTELHYVATRR